MSDGIKAWHEEEEDKRAKADWEKFKNIPLETIYNDLQNMKNHVSRLNISELRLTAGEHYLLLKIKDTLGKLV